MQNLENNTQDLLNEFSKAEDRLVYKSQLYSYILKWTIWKQN